MARNVSLEEADRRYAEKSLRCFIDGEKYTRDRKAKSINWLIGVINASSVDANELKMIVANARYYPKTIEEANRFNQAERGIKEIIESRTV